MDIKKSFLRWKLLPGSVPSQAIPCKTTTPKQERKLPVKGQITVTSTPKKLRRPLYQLLQSSALLLLNYEEPITKDIGTNSSLFELLDHDYSLYHTNYNKDNNFGSKIQGYSTQIQQLKKEIYSFNTKEFNSAQELKSKKLSLKKSEKLEKCGTFLYCFSKF